MLHRAAHHTKARLSTKTAIGPQIHTVKAIQESQRNILENKSHQKDTELYTISSIVGVFK